MSAPDPKEPNYDDATAEALEGSIKKWEQIVAGEAADRYANNCPLCQLFTIPSDSCDGCPVKTVTELESCEGSPWDAWDEHQQEEHSGEVNGRRVRCGECLRLAQAELDFLRSLRK